MGGGHMSSKRAVWLGMSVVLVGLAALLFFFFAPSGVRGQENIPSEDVAVEKAKAEARFAGLQGEPTSYVAARMTLVESLEPTEQLGKDAAAFGLDPNMPVWVVLFRGNILLSLPGGGGRPFDNLTVVLDARTGKVVGWRAYPAGQLVRVPVPGSK